MRSRFGAAVVLLLAAAAAALIGPAAWALCAPSTQGIFPASGIVGTSVTATVTGTGLAGATAEVFGAAGLDVQVQSASDTSVSLQLQIDAAAAPGERILSLETPGGAVAMSFTVNPVGGPVVDDVSPTPIATQGFGLVLDVTGSGLGGLGTSNVSVSGTGVTVTSALASSDSALELSLDVAGDAELGTHAIVIESPTGGAVFQLYVLPPAPVIDALSPGAGEIGATVPLTITGTSLTGASLVITSGDGTAGGVLVTNVATPNDSTLIADLIIDGGLAPESEPRRLIVTTESGQATTDFFVVAAGVPSLTGIGPGAGEPGDTVGVTLRGLNLTGATLSTTSGDISFQNASVIDDETIAVDVVVAGGAATDADHTITASVGMDDADITFRVISPGTPFFASVRPPFGNRGATFPVILDGVNLSTVVIGTGVQLSGPKIVESNAEALDDRTVRAILELDETASVGFRDVTVTTAGGSFERTAAFRVNIPGQLPIITDVSPSVVDPGTTTTITVTGSGFGGAGVSVGGPGAVVTNLGVDEFATTITFDLTLDADAPGESRPLIVVTENGSAICRVLSLPGPIDLRVAKLVKTGSVFEVSASGYRLFLFEFSLNERFDEGPRTVTFAGSEALLTLSRLDAENVRRATRDLPFGYVRVRAVTATSQLGTSVPQRFRR